MAKQMKELDNETPFIAMTLILDENQCQRFARIAKEKDIRNGTIVLGRGTVENAILNLLGIKNQKKTVVNILIEEERAMDLLNFFDKEFQLNKPGHGIAYTAPIIAADRIINNDEVMEGKSMLKKLTVIVNRGMAEDVMEIARRSGVKGGTIMHGRGTGSEVTEKLFGIEIEPEKELVIILMPSELIEKVTNDLFNELKLDMPGNGFLFVEPILQARGLFSGKED